MGIEPTTAPYVCDKPLFSWQGFTRGCQPHAPRQVLMISIGEPIEVPLPAGAADYLA